MVISQFIPVTFQPNVRPSKGPSSPMSAKEIEISADHLSAISLGLFTVVPTGTFTFHNFSIPTKIRLLAFPLTVALGVQYLIDTDRDLITVLVAT